MKLSVIIPFANEWPMNVFTIRNIAEELRDRADFEILAVCNSSENGDRSGAKKGEVGEPYRTFRQLEGVARGHKWLKPLAYRDKLSHWQAKNLAVQHSTGEILWFCDAHCIISRDALYNAFNYYQFHHEELNGTLHLPLTYHIMEFHKLVYKLVDEREKGVMAYSFSEYRPPDYVNAYRVPCMSTCGMMMSRAIYDEIGGWPVELGIYGGGEHFINFVLAILGKTINIMPGGALCHHGDKRGYSWNYDDYHRNRMIATYMFGGAEWLQRYAAHMAGNPERKRDMVNEILTNDSCTEQRAMIAGKQILTIEEWADEWRK